MYTPQSQGLMERKSPTTGLIRKKSVGSGVPAQKSIADEDGGEDQRACRGRAAASPAPWGASPRRSASTAPTASCGGSRQPPSTRASISITATLANSEVWNPTGPDADPARHARRRAGAGADEEREHQEDERQRRRAAGPPTPARSPGTRSTSGVTSIASTNQRSCCRQMPAHGGVGHVEHPRAVDHRHPEGGEGHARGRRERDRPAAGGGRASCCTGALRRTPGRRAAPPGPPPRRRAR